MDGDDDLWNGKIGGGELLVLHIGVGDHPHDWVAGVGTLKMLSTSRSIAAWLLHLRSGFFG